MSAIKCEVCNKEFSLPWAIPELAVKCECGQAMVIPGTTSLTDLTSYLCAKDPKTRKAAVALLSKKYPSNADGPLRRILDEDSDAGVKSLARRALDRLGLGSGNNPPKASPPSTAGSTEKSPEDETGRKLLDSERSVRIEGILEVEQRRLDSCVPLLLKLLDEDDDPHVKATLVKTLGYFGSQEVKLAILKELKSSDSRIRANAIEGLGNLDTPEPDPELLKALSDKDGRIRANAAKALAKWNVGATAEALAKMATHEDVSYRDSCQFVCKTLAKAEFLPILEVGIKDSVRSVQAKAREGLEKLVASGNRQAQSILDQFSCERVRREDDLSAFVSGDSTVGDPTVTDSRQSDEPTSSVGSLEKTTDEVLPKKCPFCNIPVVKMEGLSTDECAACGASLVTPSGTRSRPLDVTGRDSKPHKRQRPSGMLIFLSVAGVTLACITYWPVEINIPTPASQVESTSPSVESLEVDPETLSQLGADIAEVESEVSRVELENAVYSGGLVKSLIILRLQVLKNTLAMLQQKKLAMQHGVALNFTVEGLPYVPKSADPKLMAGLDAEISEQTAKFAELQVQNAQYSGGLIKATLLVSSATVSNTIALLEQRKLLAKYGIPQMVLPQVSSVQETEDASQPSAGPKFEIVSIDFRATEKNSTWWRYAYILELKNLTDEVQSFSAEIEFQDSEGFVVETENLRNLILRPRETDRFTGSALVQMPSAANVARVNSKVNLK